MLTMPLGASPIATIVGIDPGSYTFGMAVLHVNIESWEIIGADAWTFKGLKLAGKHDWVSELHGERIGSVQAIAHALLQALTYYQPFDIASESPFIGSFPQAGIALTEVICAIRWAVSQYDAWKAIHLVDPPSVKNAVGIHTRIEMQDKHIVKKKLMALPDLRYTGAVPLTLLDEHAIDALAVAYCRYRRLRS